MNHPAPRDDPSREAPRRLPIRTIATVAAAGPLLAAAGLAAFPVADVPWAALAAVAAAACAAYLAIVPVGLHGEANLDDAVLVLAMVSLPGVLVAPAFAIGVLAAEAIRRRPFVKSAFNLGSDLTGTSLAVGAAYLAGFADAPLQQQAVLAFGAALLKSVLMAVLVTIVTARIERVPLVQRAVTVIGRATPLTAASAAYGVLTLFATRQTPWALAVAAGVASVFLLRVRRQEPEAGGRAGQLVAFARDLQRAHDLDEVQDLLDAAARGLFGAEGARFVAADHPPRPGRDVHLPGRGERLILDGLPGGLPIPLERRETLATVASLAAAARERLSVMERLGRDSLRDPLTDAFNRRRFDRDLRELVGARRPFALALVDLDGFKQLNDLHGHQAGDALLRTLTTELRDAFRGNDRVYRIGGDEFALLLPGAPAEVARERFSAFLASWDQHHRPEDRPQVGLSVGLAEFPRHAHDVDPLVARADAALYEVKRRGGHGLATPDEE